MTSFYITKHYGGPDIPNTLEEFVRALSKSIQTLSNNIYSSEINKFGIILRVSGEISKFEEESGCSHLKLFKKKKSIQVDITIQQEIWRQGEEKFKPIIKSFLIDAFKSMAAKIKKEKLDINNDKFLTDLSQKVSEIE